MTGGAGFIGSHVVSCCIRAGYPVVVVDDLSTGKEENLDPAARLYRLDLRDRGLGEVLGSEGISHVFHLGAQVDVQVSLEDPRRDASVNILGTINLLEACRVAGVKKVVYASSAAVYGEPRYLPVDEKHPLDPLSGYGLSKEVPERYLKLYRELYGLDYTVLRYANVYGPRQDASGEGGVVAIFMDRMLRGARPVIFGDGEQVRDFVYVEDVARANLQAMGRGSGQALNISTCGTVSVNQLFALTRELTRQDLEPEYQGERPGDIRESYLDNTRGKAVLQWEAAVPFPEGLRRTRDYFARIRPGPGA